MKNFMVLTVMTLAFGGTSFAAESLVPAELGLALQCSSRIFVAAKSLCEKESKGDSGREHLCLSSQSQVGSDSANGADFEISFTVGDADSYWFKIDVTDKENCKFSLKAEQ